MSDKPSKERISQTCWDLNLSNMKIRNVTQRRVAMLGGPGTGKTTTLKLLALHCPVDVKMFIFDPINTQTIHDIENYDRIKINKKGVEDGKQLGTFMNNTRVTARGTIFSFIDFNSKERVQFINGMFQTWRPKNCIIAFDEMHEFTPERGVDPYYSLQVEEACRSWRNVNVGIIINSQRPAFVSKKVLGITDYMILFRTTWPADVKTVNDMLRQMNHPQHKNIMQQLQTLPFLEGYAVDFRKQEFKNRVGKNK